MASGRERTWVLRMLSMNSSTLLSSRVSVSRSVTDPTANATKTTGTHIPPSPRVSGGGGATAAAAVRGANSYSMVIIADRGANNYSMVIMADRRERVWAQPPVHR